MACVAVACIFLPSLPAQSHGAKQISPQTRVPDSDRGHIKEGQRMLRSWTHCAWRTIGRTVPKSLPEQGRNAGTARRRPQRERHTQDYHQVAGRVRRKPEEGPYDGE